MILAAALGSALLAGCSSAPKETTAAATTAETTAEEKKEESKAEETKAEEKKEEVLAMICCPGKQETLQRPEMEKDRR